MKDIEEMKREEPVQEIKEEDDDDKEVHIESVKEIPLIRPMNA